MTSTNYLKCHRKRAMPIHNLPPCPNCGSHNHEVTGQPLLSKNRQHIATVVRCFACGREWKETYDLRIPNTTKETRHD